MKRKKYHSFHIDRLQISSVQSRISRHQYERVYYFTLHGWVFLVNGILESELKYYILQ